MNKQCNIRNGMILHSILAVSAGLLIGWGLFVLPIDYPFRPYFLFVTAPAVLLVFVNIRMLKDEPKEMWGEVINMVILLFAANFPIAIEAYTGAFSGGGYEIEQHHIMRITQIVHYFMVLVGVNQTVIRNIVLIRACSH